jgi:hypothetical protein
LMFLHTGYPPIQPARSLLLRGRPEQPAND